MLRRGAITIKMTYLGHSAFRLETGGKNILIDPFLAGNPTAAVKPDNMPADLILVTHGHSDHLGDAIAIAKRTGATIMGVIELANYCAEKGAKTIDGNIGGVNTLPYCEVKYFPAFHGSTSPDGQTLGNPCSYVLSAERKHIFHAGDTALFGDMALIADQFDLDVACLPIGGHYTMGIDDAVRAQALLRAKTVVPMHYNTWDVISADPLEFGSKIAKQGIGNCKVLRPGETLSLYAAETHVAAPGF
jgi:L-ascorbate metabolism protein UlaG (beta-lactamase superfamily)